ncbi:Endonuclease/exonuclease/phosphatase [Corchorus capsularis]|uniref:Endonuclease/exonuclease/phosphatase n=1 Tax=Corchorus capsularis TaxID=210143 RepID=A0A1R3G4U8_COCAP|nr:Endonuclease/exonuclease/phosphatase [Corchorus capsularis]
MMDDVVLDLEVVKGGESETSGWSVVGRVIAEKSLNRGAVKMILRYLWSEKEVPVIGDVGSSMYSLAIKEIDLGEVSFWVQIHNLPQDMMVKSNADRIGASLGQVLKVEEPRGRFGPNRSFLRLRLLLPCEKPLLPGFWVPREDGNRIWAEGPPARPLLSPGKQRSYSWGGGEENRQRNWNASRVARELTFGEARESVVAGENATKTREILGGTSHIPIRPAQQKGKGVISITDKIVEDNQEAESGSPKNSQPGDVEKEVLAHTVEKVVVLPKCFEIQPYVDLGPVSQSLVDPGLIAQSQVGQDSEIQPYVVQEPSDGEQSERGVPELDYECESIVERSESKMKVEPVVNEHNRKVSTLSPTKMLKTMMNLSNVFRSLNLKRNICDDSEWATKSKKLRLIGGNEQVSHGGDSRMGMDIVQAQLGLFHCFDLGNLLPKAKKKGRSRGKYKKKDRGVRIMEINADEGNLNEVPIAQIEHFTGGFGGCPTTATQGLQRIWDRIIDRVQMSTSPIVCTGDFNDILCQEEKQGGNLKEKRKMDGFRRFSDECNFLDLGFQGQLFTWFCTRDGELIKERLDRYFANGSWIQSFPNAQVFNLPAAEDPGCECIVRKGWQMENEGSGCYKLAQKLRHNNLLLSKWSKEAFPNNKEVIEQLMAKMQVIPTTGSGEENLIEYKRVTEELNEAWEKEEKYWYQRSRIKWTLFGDQNTVFFHQTTIQRRQRNKILRIKDNSGEWLEDEASIVNHFSQYYRDLFTTDGERNWDEVLNHVLELVTSDMNTALTACISEEENAFVADRQIQDNILVAKEVFHYLRLKKKGMRNDLALKLDMNKAYDRVEWDFLETKDVIANCLGVSIAQCRGTYLGIPSLWGKTKREVLSVLKGRIMSRIQGWKQLLLSQGGREVMIKAVFIAIPMYLMACFKCPKSFCQELNAAAAKFWWGQQKEEGKIHWVSWERLTHCKKECGMGFRELEFFKLSLLAKYAWRLMHSDNSLWAQGGKLSPIADAQPNNDQRVQEVIEEDTRTWSLQTISHMIPVSEKEATMDIPLSFQVKDDKIIWPQDKTGKYSVKTGYRVLKEEKPNQVRQSASSSHNIDQEVWKIIWNLKVPVKIKQFLWRLMEKAVATNLAIFQKKVRNDPVCPFCDKVESIEHMLLKECEEQKDERKRAT